MVMVGWPARKAQSPRLMNRGREGGRHDTTLMPKKDPSAFLLILQCCSYADIDKDAIVIRKTEGTGRDLQGSAKRSADCVKQQPGRVRQKS